MRNGHQILHADQTGCEKIFQGRPQMQTRDLFAVLSLHGDSCAHLLRTTLDHAALTVARTAYLTGVLTPKNISIMLRSNY